MRKIISLILVTIVTLMIPFHTLANDNPNVIVSSSTTYVPEKVMETDMQDQINKRLESLIKSSSLTRDQYDWTYTTEYGSPKYVTKSGYAGGQNAGGVKFDYPGGAFSWTPSGGPTLSASVSFPVPYTSCSVNVDLELAKANDSLEYIQAVNNYTDYVKLYVYKTMKVTPYVIYRTNIHTGVKEAYTTGSTSTMYSHKFEVRKV